MNKIQNVQRPILEKYKNYLTDDYKSCVKDEVSLNLTMNSARPAFAKPRSVPLKLKEKVTEELDRLCESGILTKVQLPLCLFKGCK